MRYAAKKRKVVRGTRRAQRREAWMGMATLDERGRRTPTFAEFTAK